MSSLLRWGILATGNIARAFAQGLAHSKTGQLVAVGSRSTESAQRFGREFGLKDSACHATYEALLADPQVEAIYISNPHPGHAEWAIKCAEAGRHILCEKPLAMNHAEAMAVIEAARRHDVFLMEAFMYRCHPQTQKIVELIRAGAIGAVHVVQAAFSFRAANNPDSRLLASELGGGGILDVGCYPVSFARLVAGVAAGATFANPRELQGFGHLGDTGIDDYAVAIARFDGDFVAQLSTGVRVTQENVARIYGEEGHIFVPNPWSPTRDGGTSRIVINRPGKEPEEMLFELPADARAYLYTIEADHVSAHLAARQSPAMSWDDSLGNMQTLDLWRERLALTYPVELPDHKDAKQTVAHRALRTRADAPMPYGKVSGLDKPVSRLVLGCDNQRTYAQAAAIFDNFFELGGNAFDTAYIYHAGLQERLVGQWLRNRRDIRDQIVVIAKGAHTPHCNPESITKQLHESLERLQSDHVDLYMMHRDNPEIPASDFIDVLNEHRRAGRIGAFGGSNWSVARVTAANAYARERGLQGFTIVSNNFSLARMVSPVWAGCVAASDPASRAWFTEHQLALFGWSSQARGFFLPTPPVSSGNGPTEAEIARCWHSDDNFQRRERALALAREKGVSAINIALAYVLCQPFPTFPLVGPRTLEEIRTTLPALQVHLSANELAWLDLERETP